MLRSLFIGDNGTRADSRAGKTRLMDEVKTADTCLPMTTYHVTIDGRLVIVTGRMTEAEAKAQARRMLAETDAMIQKHRRFL